MNREEFLGTSEFKKNFTQEDCDSFIAAGLADSFLELGERLGEGGDTFAALNTFTMKNL